MIFVLSYEAYAILIIIIAFLWKFTRRTRSIPKDVSQESVIREIPSVDPDFNWKTTQPLPIRPFVKKRNFNPSMGVKNISNQPQDWLLVEETYLANVDLRKSVIAERPQDVIFAKDDPQTQLAVKETYELIVSFFISRYPQYFVEDEKEQVINKITNLLFPRYGNNYSSLQLLTYLNENIEEDLLILIKDDPTDLQEEYKMKASLNGAPAGFDPKINHNKPVSFIHTPVPQYETRLQHSMHKFFNNLQPKDLWVRHNWSIQTNSNRFNLDSLHGRQGDEIIPLEYDEVNFDETFLRCERQIFTRLPKSRANLMTIRTYLTPIAKIKQEGLADELIRGIDSLPEDLAFYKRRGAWGNAVKQYLRQ